MVSLEFAFSKNATVQALSSQWAYQSHTIDKPLENRYILTQRTQREVRYEEQVEDKYKNWRLVHAKTTTQ